MANILYVICLYRVALLVFGDNLLNEGCGTDCA